MFLDVRDKSKRRMITAKIRVIRERNRVSSFLGFSLLVQFSLFLLSLVVSLLESSIFSLTSFSFRRLTWNIWLIFQDVLGLLNGQVYKKCISWRHLFYRSVIKERALLCLVSNERLLQISYNMRMWICKSWRMRRIDITSLFYCETRVGCKTLINQTKLIGRREGGGGREAEAWRCGGPHRTPRNLLVCIFFSIRSNMHNAAIGFHKSSSHKCSWNRIFRLEILCLSPFSDYLSPRLKCFRGLISFYLHTWGNFINLFAWMCGEFRFTIWPMIVGFFLCSQMSLFTECSSVKILRRCLSS